MEQEKEKEEEQKQEDWDKQRQELDQVKANQEKIQAERDTLAGQLEQMQTSQAELQEQLEAAKQTKAQQEDDGLDGTLVDPAVVKTIRKLTGELKEVREKSQSLEEKAKQYEAQEAEVQAKKVKEKAIESVLSPLDKKHGAKYRSAAQKLANELIEKGEEQVPADAIASYLLMEKCYSKLANEEKAKKEKPVSTDTGLGGTAWYNDDKLRQGTLEDVAAEMKKENKWKGGLPE